MTTITNQGASSGSASSRAIDNSKDVARKFGTDAIATGGVGTSDIADGAVTTVKHGDLSVTTAKLADVGVTTAKLADLGVTTAKVAAGAVEGKKLALTGIKCRSFTGLNGAGAVALAGLAVGDRVLAVFETTATDDAAAAKFEAAVTIVDQLQQSSVSNLSAKRYIAILLAPAA